MNRLVLSLLVAAFGCVAQAELSVTVQAGAGGTIRGNCIAPVQVLISNPDADLRGAIEAAFLQGIRELASSRMPLDLPQNSRKSVFLYIPAVPETADTVRIRFLRDGRYTVIEHKERLTTNSESLPHFGAVGRFPDGLPDLHTKKERNRYFQLFLTADRVPQRWEGLQMYDCFMIVPPLDDALEIEQVQALREWVLRGGTLVIDVSEPKDAYATGALNDLLPLAPLGVETVQLDLLGKECPIGRCDHRRGNVLLQSNGKPLVVRENFGLGSIVCFAISPASTDFVSWSGHTEIWKTALQDIDFERAERMEDANFGTMREDQIGQLKELIVAKESGAVRLGAVFILIALYAAAIGPGDRWLVRRLGKPHLTWVTFPSMVAFFTLAAWFGAKYFVGGEMSAAAVGRILVDQEHHLAAQYDLASLFAPRTDEYKLQLKSGALVGELHSSILIGDEPLHANLEDHSLLFQIPSWQQRVFAGSATIDTWPDIAVSMEKRGNERIVTVENKTQRPLTNVRAYFGTAQFPHSGNLGAGETCEIPLTDGTRVGYGKTLSSRGTFMQTRDQGSISATLREFDTSGALARGATVVSAQITANAPNPLIVDGSQRPETCSQIIEFVIHPNSSPSNDGGTPQ
jgi:hypothetical protein